MKLKLLKLWENDFFALGIPQENISLFLENDNFEYQRQAQNLHASDDPRDNFKLRQTTK